MADIDFTRMNDEIQAMAEKFGLSSEALANFVKVTGKSTKEFKKQIDELNKEVKKGKKTYEDQKRLLDELNESIDELGDTTNDMAATTKKATLIAERNALSYQASLQKTKESAEKFGEALGKSAIVGTATFVRQLQSGASATELASGLMNVGIDAVAAGLHTVGSGLAVAGQAVTTFAPGWYKAAGVVLSGLGMLAVAAGETGSHLFKFGVEILNKEVDKTIKSFNTISATGATFVNGLTGMRTAASESGLTVEQFGTVISANSSNIAMAGLGYTDTLKKLAGVQKIFAAGTNSTRLQLQKLGFSFEDQASLTLETMSDMRRGGLLRGASDDQIAQQTKEYAQNLRIISAITGEDAKAKMAQARTAMQNSAVQSKLLEMQKNNPEAYKKLQAQLATMPAEMQKAYIQKITIGNVVDPISASLMAQMPAMETALNGYQSVLEDSSKNATDATMDAGKQNALLGQAMTSQMKNFSVFGINSAAGIGGMGSDLDKMISGMFDKTSGLGLDIADKARAGVLAQQNANDTLTSSLMAASGQAQNLAMALQDKVLPLLNRYAETTEAILSKFDEYIAKALGSDAIAPRNEKELKNKYSITYGEKYGKDRYQQDLKAWNDEQAWRTKIQELKDAGQTEEYDAELAKKAKAKKQRENLKAATGGAYGTEPVNMIGQYVKSQSIANGKEITAHDKGGSISTGKLGLVGENGPEIISGPANVLSTASTGKLLDVLNAMKLQSGTLTGDDGMDKTVTSSEKLQGIIADQLKGFEKFSQAQIQDALTAKQTPVSMQPTTEQVLVAMDALREKQGIRFGGNGFDWQVGMNEDRWAVLAERIKPLEDALGADVIQKAIAAEKAKVLDPKKSGYDRINNDNLLMGLISKYYGSQLNDPEMKKARDAMGFAKGGIASGSLGGYQAELHGTEAVVPLPDNKSIPVKLDSSALTATLHEQTGLLNSILASLNKGNSLSSGILQNSY